MSSGLGFSCMYGVCHFEYGVYLVISGVSGFFG